MNVRPSEDVTNEAYHGTSDDCARAIISDGFTLPQPSPDNRYGRAVYFWLNSKDQARWWARKMKGVRVIAVIRAKVAYGKHLNVVSWEGQDLLLKIARKISEATRVQKVTEAAVLNFMAEKGWIETALILDLPQTSVGPILAGFHSVQGTRLILSVYRLENILDRTIVLTEAA
jgi:hypothetical protein